MGAVDVLVDVHGFHHLVPILLAHVDLLLDILLDLFVGQSESESSIRRSSQKETQHQGLRGRLRTAGSGCYQGALALRHRFVSR
jgi:hypothetical protein